MAIEHISLNGRPSNGGSDWRDFLANGGIYVFHIDDEDFPGITKLSHIHFGVQIPCNEPDSGEKWSDWVTISSQVTKAGGTLNYKQHHSGFVEVECRI